MTGPRSGAFKQFLDPRSQFRKRREQHRRVEIALDRGTIADVHPSLIDVNSPIDAHDVASGRVKFLEKTCCAGSKVNHGHSGGADALNQSPGIRRHETDVVVGAERADPAIEDLNGASAGGHLRNGEWTEHVD